jgi:predicted transcriptional regulator
MARIKSEYRTIAEIARRIGRSVRTTSRLHLQGKIPTVKIGGVIYMSEAAWQDKLNQKQAQ